MMDIEYDVYVKMPPKNRRKVTFEVINRRKGVPPILKLKEEMENIPPEFAKILNDNFWDLL